MINFEHHHPFPGELAAALHLNREQIETQPSRSRVSYRSSVNGQSRVLSVAWGSNGFGFDVRCKAPSQSGPTTRSVHDA